MVEAVLSQLSQTIYMPDTHSPEISRSTNQKIGSTHSGNNSTAVETIEARPEKVRTWPTLFTSRGVMNVLISNPAEYPAITNPVTSVPNSAALASTLTRESRSSHDRGTKVQPIRARSTVKNSPWAQMLQDFYLRVPKMATVRR